MSRAWMPLYVGDYLRDTRDLNTLQHGAYLLLIMHYWQHAGLPSDDARLAAIAGLSVAQWRRTREPVQAKFSAGWKHKRIDAEIAKTDRASMQRRLAGQSGGIKSGIARTVARGAAIIAAQAEGKRALARRSGEPQTGVQPPATNHNHRFDSSSASLSESVTRRAHASAQSASAAASSEGDQRVPANAKPAGGKLASHKPANHKPANQWSREELDALFARRVGAGIGQAPSPDASTSADSSNTDRGE